jgi:N-methylhydantoinase B
MTNTTQIQDQPAVAADPIVAEIVRNALKTAARQIELAVMRTSVSPILYDAHDFACGIFDAEAQLLGQDEGVPAFLGSLGLAIEVSVENSGGAEALRPGDVLLTTDAYNIGSHAQDATIIVPAFDGDQLIGFAAIKGHINDIGQRDQLMAADTKDIWQEGTVYPGVKLYQAGERSDALWRTVLANSRQPDDLAADLNAFIGSVRVGVAALERVVGRYGREVFEACVERIFDHGEQVARAAIEAIPDGRYVAQAVIEGGDAGAADRFDVVVEIEGSDILVDYTAAPPQQELPFNAPVGFTAATTRAFVLALVGGADSATEGYMRPIKMRTEPGTMLHPVRPAPVGLYFNALDPPEAIYRALSAVIPDAVPGSVGGSTQWLIAYGMKEDGSFWGGGFNFIGGQGAAPTHDGTAPMLGIAGGGVRSVSAEIFESRTPLVVEEVALAEDSAGPGRHRGCPGIDYRIRARTMMFATLIADGTVHPPGQGIAGGLDGRPNRLSVEAPDGSVVDYEKVGSLPIMPDSVVAMKSGGGGGYGPPSDRDAEAVRRDVADGYLSAAEAQRVYGVDLDGPG